MPQVVQQGQLNTAALSVADVYVEIIAPQLLINGIPTNIVGLVGTAAWGPVGGAAIVGPYADYAAQFGDMQARKYDMGSHLWAAQLQGGQAVFRCSRVTDGTDVAASIAVLTNCITITSLYTGTKGNSQSVIIGPGTAASSVKVTVNTPGQISEVFDNLTGTGNALWVAIANAINNGLSNFRGPSKMVVATAGVGVTAAPGTATTYTLTSGTDGATTITSSVLLGVDTAPRKGMYSLRGTGCSIALLADCDDTTSWTTQVSFGLGEGIYMVCAGASGESITTAVTNKASAGLDSYAAKLMLGDWVTFNDTVNGVQRQISPQGFVAGVLGNLAPNQSSLNKPMQGIVATQQSKTGRPYSVAELQVLANAGIDVICNPIPYGSVFGCRNGRNTSSNAAIRGDNYTRMTNFIAWSVAAGMGKYVGQVQTRSDNDPVRRRAKTTLDSFFSVMQYSARLIGTPEGPDAWKVTLDNSNNPGAAVGLGYMRASVQVEYQSIIEFFIIDIEGGQTVNIQRSVQPLAA